MSRPFWLTLAIATGLMVVGFATMPFPDAALLTIYVCIGIGVTGTIDIIRRNR